MALNCLHGMICKTLTGNKNLQGRSVMGKEEILW